MEQKNILMIALVGLMILIGGCGGRETEEHAAPAQPLTTTPTPEPPAGDPPKPSLIEESIDIGLGEDQITKSKFGAIKKERDNYDLFILGEQGEQKYISRRNLVGKENFNEYVLQEGTNYGKIEANIEDLFSLKDVKSEQTIILAKDSNGLYVLDETFQTYGDMNNLEMYFWTEEDIKTYGSDVQYLKEFVNIKSYNYFVIPPLQGERYIRVLATLNNDNTISFFEQFYQGNAPSNYFQKTNIILDGIPTLDYLDFDITLTKTGDEYFYILSLLKGDGFINFYKLPFRVSSPVSYSGINYQFVNNIDTNSLETGNLALKKILGSSIKVEEMNSLQTETRSKPAVDYKMLKLYNDGENNYADYLLLYDEDNELQILKGKIALPFPVQQANAEPAAGDVS